jgi:protein-disulfide isomerase
MIGASHARQVFAASGLLRARRGARRRLGVHGASREEAVLPRRAGIPQADAKIQIAEFSDFQCPACRVAEPPLRQIFQVYEGKVRFIFKHYPLRMHQWAKPAADAAECAGRQGKFWEYHDRLYDKQDEWTNDKADSFFTAYAKDLKLDVPAWQACRQDPSATAAYETDMKDGDNAWVSATPTFFINGRRFVGAKQLAELGTFYMAREMKK